MDWTHFFTQTIPCETCTTAVRRAGAKYLVSSVPIALALSGCSSAKMLSIDDTSRGPVARPAIVYVADFKLAPDSIQSETRLTALPIHSFLEQTKAQSLVAEMSSAIVKDLGEKGITAVRLTANSPLPKDGWLVQGAFMKVDEGNRVRRAVIGFGSGQTDIQVATTTDALSAGAEPAPLYRGQVDAKSDKLPGAGLTLNPYAAAAKYVLAGFDLDISTQKTAEKIADAVASRVKGTS